VERPSFDRELEELLKPVNVALPRGARRMPEGHARPAEARLETFGPRVFPDRPIWEDLRRWWLKHPTGANTPNWDLAVECEIEGVRGLCLIEAKANAPELSSAGKLVRKGSSPRSRENTERIDAALHEAAAALSSAGDEAHFSVSKSYQLANRLAFAWKLATGGVPVVLVYLGFLGDTGITDVGDLLADASHWNGLFAEHLADIAPGISVDQRVNVGAGFWILSRSCNVLSPSGPAPVTHRNTGAREA